MKLQLFITSSDSERVPAVMVPMTKTDAMNTIKEPIWQSDWTSEYISDDKFEKYALKTNDSECVALAAFEILEKYLYVHIVYMESAPDSNPTMTVKKKYSGIGKAIIAYAIKLSVEHGFGGVVLMEGKTPELARHYINDFDAIPLPSGFGTVSAPRFMVDGEAAINLISDYLS